MVSKVTISIPIPAPRFLRHSLREAIDGYRFARELSRDLNTKPKSDLAREELYVANHVISNPTSHIGPTALGMFAHYILHPVKYLEVKVADRCLF